MEGGHLSGGVVPRDGGSRLHGGREGGLRHQAHSWCYGPPLRDRPGSLVARLGGRPRAQGKTLGWWAATMWPETADWSMARPVGGTELGGVVPTRAEAAQHLLPL